MSQSETDKPQTPKNKVFSTAEILLNLINMKHADYAIKRAKQLAVKSTVMAQSGVVEFYFCDGSFLGINIAQYIQYLGDYVNGPTTDLRSDNEA